MKEFHIISAVSLNGVIGDSLTNSMPWYIPLDLKHFKTVTMGKAVVMGSRTFNSIGRVLPNRRNVVITRNQAGEASYLKKAGVDELYMSFNDALKNERPGFFVIGGQHIYGEAIRAIPTSLYITIIDQEVEGDVRFPIPGHSFKENMICTQQGAKYVCKTRSAWFEDGGYKIQFTRFDYVP
jgi:dihydrofolate reductase